MDTFHIFLFVMTGIAVIVFVALYFVKAGYGMFFDAKWGRPLNNRLGWVLMESPVFVAMLLYWYFSDRRFDIVPFLFFLFFRDTLFPAFVHFPVSAEG